MHRKLRSNQVVPTAEELHNLLLGYYLGETDFREVAKAFNTRIIVAEEWEYYELSRVYVEIKAILKNLVVVYSDSNRKPQTTVDIYLDF